MASPSQDPFAETNSDATSQPAPAPAKRSLFKNRKARVVKTAEEQAAEAVDFFSRSKEIFPEALKEKRERREREERRKAERMLEEEEEEAKNAALERERRERRYAPDDEGDGEEAGELRKARAKSRSCSASRSITPPRNRSISADSFTNPVHNDSPPHKRRSPRNERRTRSQAEQPNPVISLSSDEDEDADPRLAKQRSLHAAQDHRHEHEGSLRGGYDEFASPPGAPQRPKRRSPSVEDMPAEDEMFPELVAAARAQAAAEQAEKLRPMQRKMMGRTKSASSNGSGSPRDVTGHESPVPIPSSPLVTRDVPKEDPIISIYVDSRVEGLTEVIIVKRKLSQRFKDVRMAWCDKQVIQVFQGHRGMLEMEKESIFLSWRGRRVWDVTTAESLGIKVDGRGHVVDEKGLDLGGNVHLEAWTQDAYEQWQREKKAEKARIASGVAFAHGEQVNLDDDDARASQPLEAPLPPAPAVEKIKIVLKAKGDESVKLIVKATTRIEKILEGYMLQRQELCRGKTVELWFDGERLEGGSTVGEADVEDMSGIDVVLREA